MDKQEKEIIKISVRNLVEFILRSGNLDNRRSSAADREAMQKGSKIHRKIQKQMKTSYRAEVPLKWDQEYSDFIIRVEGRADGIIEEEDRTVIDEIKGVYMDLAYLEEPVMVHKAQAMCYAFIYGTQTEAENMDVQMTYCQIETEEIKRFCDTFTLSYLKNGFRICWENIINGQSFSIKGELREESLWKDWSFPILTGKDKENWCQEFIIPLQKDGSFLFRLLPA